MDNKKFELDMLEGNINRISVTHSMKELKEMVFYANLRIYNLYKIKQKEISEEGWHESRS